MVTKEKSRLVRDGKPPVEASPESAKPVQPIQEIRAFNRFYTNLIGALDYSRHLYVPYTLTEARVLYELARSPRTDAADLRSELSLDAGYLSRLLAKFEKDELVERAPSMRDSRRQSISLTGHGHSTAELLDERSQESVGGLLATVPSHDLPRLTEAMHTIRTILCEEPLPSESPDRPAESSSSRPPRREDVLLRPPAPGDLGWIIERNAFLYASEYSWNEEYEALVARIVADFAQNHDPRLERVWIAELDERPVGCVMCVRDDHDDKDTTEDTDTPPVYEHDQEHEHNRGHGHGHSAHDHGGTATGSTTASAHTPADGSTAAHTPAVSPAPAHPRPDPPAPAPAQEAPHTARLRLLLVEPDARGLGIGDQLVSACIDFARHAGYQELVLWTNDILSAARSIYQRHGFTLTAEQAHHSFGADLVGQDWWLRLRDVEREHGTGAEMTRIPERGR